MQKLELSWLSGNSTCNPPKWPAFALEMGAIYELSLLVLLSTRRGPFSRVFRRKFSQNQHLRKANGGTKMTYERIMLMLILKDLRSSQSCSVDTKLERLRMITSIGIQWHSQWFRRRLPEWPLLNHSTRPTNKTARETNKDLLRG